MQRIGIMGGTFNPVHKGHLALARAARKEFALDRVIFIPSGNPPHKERSKIIDKELRFKMVKLALRGKRGYAASRMELDRPGFSYAVDTFRTLRKRFGRTSRLYYIMGMDSLNEILAWKKPLELFRLCEFIVGTRPGTKLRTFRQQANKIHLIALRENISASGIRERLKAGKPVKRMVPAAVADFIRRRELYGPHPGEVVSRPHPTIRQ